MLNNARIALVGLGMLLLSLPACTNDEELAVLRAENARLRTDVETLEEEVAVLLDEVAARESSHWKVLGCLRETRITLDEVTRAVQDLPDEESLFLTAGSFRTRYCRGVLKAGTMRGLARQVAAADKVFAAVADARVAALLGPPERTGGGGGGDCNPNYTGCLRANASDYDCAGGDGDGPYFTGTVQVIGVDEYDLDRDDDGTACD